MTRLRGWFFDNASLKLLALLLAVLLHLVVRRDAVREMSMRLPLGVTGVPAGRVFVGQLPAEVEVQVRGRWRGLRELLEDRARRLDCDLSNHRDGERYVFDLQRVTAQLGRNEVEVLAVRPSAFEVQLDRLTSRSVPVQVSTTGDPATGFMIGPESLHVSPETVEVTGPATDVRRIRQVRAAPVDLSGADADLRVRARLLPVGSGTVKFAVEEVDVAVRLQEREISETLRSQRIVVRGCPEAMRCVLDPAVVDVVVRGRVRAIRALIAAPPDNLVLADVGPAIERKERSVRIVNNPLEGIVISLQPPVANFQLLGEIPAE